MTRQSPGSTHSLTRPGLAGTQQGHNPPETGQLHEKAARLEVGQGRDREDMGAMNEAYPRQCPRTLGEWGRVGVTQRRSRSSELIPPSSPLG